MVTAALPVSEEAESVMALPGLPSTRSRLVKAMTLAKTTGLLASSRKTTRFTVLVHRSNDPVDARIPTDSLVLGVN